jgi:hypothetical protein
MLNISKTILMSCLLAISLYGCSTKSNWVDAPKANVEKSTTVEKIEQTYQAEISAYSVDSKDQKQILVYSNKYKSVNDGNNIQIISYGHNPFSDNDKDFIFLDKTNNTTLDGKIFLISSDDKTKAWSSTNLSSNKTTYVADCDTGKKMNLSIPEMTSHMVLKEVTTFPYEEKIVLNNYIIVLKVTKN